MRKLIVFNSISLDGYFTGENGDLSWAHKDNDDPEWASFVQENAKSGGEMIFGRVTYEMMAGYWPSAEARSKDPVVAEQMNQLPKVVFSKTLEKADWSNTRVLRGDPVEEIRKLKEAEGLGLVIFGSGTIIARIAPHGLIDEYQFVVHPIVLGKGRTMFEGIPEKLELKQTRTRDFSSGKVLVCYEPVAVASVV